MLVKAARSIIAVAALTGLSAHAVAHEPSHALLSLEFDGDAVSGRWELSVPDLDLAMPLDTDGDRLVTWAELETARPGLLDHLGSQLTVSVAGQRCELTMGQEFLDTHGGVPFAVVSLAGLCPVTSAVAEIEYRFLATIDPTHSAITEIRKDGQTQLLLLETGEPPRTIDLETANAAGQLVDFMVEGIFHIWEGYDHLAFLALLLLPAVLARNGANRMTDVAWPIVRIVTAFTLAHSITLSLAATGTVSLPSRAVEIVIAGSIVVAAVLNLSPKATAIGAPLAFGFGLVHGFGFAGALRELGASDGIPVWSLLGFNLGVEIGQITLVLLALPVLWLVARPRALRRPLLAMSSVALGIVGSAWFIERLIG